MFPSPDNPAAIKQDETAEEIAERNEDVCGDEDVSLVGVAIHTASELKSFAIVNEILVMTAEATYQCRNKVDTFKSKMSGARREECTVGDEYGASRAPGIVEEEKRRD